MCSFIGIGSESNICKKNFTLYVLKMSLMPILRNKLINSTLVLLKSSSGKQKEKEKFVNVIVYCFKYNLVFE